MACANAIRSQRMNEVDSIIFSISVFFAGGGAFHGQVGIQDFRSV